MSDAPNPFPYTEEQIKQVQDRIEEGKRNAVKFFAEVARLHDKQEKLVTKLATTNTVFDEALPRRTKT